MRQRHDSDVHRCVTAKTEIINFDPQKKKKEHNKNMAAYRTLLTMCYWEDVTCVLWSCRYSRAVKRSCLPA